VDALMDGDEEAIKPDAPDPDADRAALIEDIDAGKLAAARARLGRMSQMVDFEKRLLVEGERVEGASLISRLLSKDRTPICCERLTEADELRLWQFLETLKPVTEAEREAKS